MHRRQLLIAGGSLMALSACASTGAASGGSAAAPSAASVAEEARIARAVLPAQAPRAELLQVWTGKYDGVPPFDKVTPAKLREAMLEGIELQRADIAAIADNPEAPTFANTMAALELAGEPLDRASNIYGVMTSNIGGEAYDAVDTELSPLLSAASDEITFNEKLFQRVKTVADTADAAGLSAQQKRLAERRRDAFIRSGANWTRPARPSWAGSTPPSPTPSPASARRSSPTRTPGR